MTKVYKVYVEGSLQGFFYDREEAEEYVREYEESVAWQVMTEVLYYSAVTMFCWYVSAA